MMDQVSKQKGITLVECIVGVSILAFAVAGPMTLASVSLRASMDARNELIATHIAEEGVEVVHNIRDNNSADDMNANRSQWMNGIFTLCSTGEGCVIDVTNRAGSGWGPNALIQCPAGNCSGMSDVYLNNDTGLYVQNASALSNPPWGKTLFKRTVSVISMDDPTTPAREVRVVSRVTYIGYGNAPHVIEVSDVLYNWFPALR